LVWLWLVSVAPSGGGAAAAADDATTVDGVVVADLLKSDVPKIPWLCGMALRTGSLQWGEAFRGRRQEWLMLHNLARGWPFDEAPTSV
jgi:hypothetical protein